MSTRTVQNWDGNISRCEYRPVNLSTKVAINNPDGLFHCFLKALRTLGPGDSECVFLDSISRDPNEYNSTWTR